MDFGLCLPTSPTGRRPRGSRPPRASPSGSAGPRSGRPTTSSSPTRDAGDYGRIYEAILTLAWVGARHPRIRLGTSVIVVPQRNAVVLAKELATLDSLSGGRVIAGVGDRLERGRVRQPGHGRPVPRPRRVPRRDDPAVAAPVVGCDRAVPRPVPRHRGLRVRAAPGAGTVADRGRRARRAGAAAGGHARRRLSLERDRAGGLRRSGSTVIAAAATAAGRPMPSLSARVRVQFDGPADSLIRDARLARGDGGGGPRLGRDRRRRTWRCPSTRPTRPRSSVGRNGSTARSSRSSSRDGLEDDLVDVAPHPVLAGLERADDRVPRVACVLARVAGSGMSRSSRPFRRSGTAGGGPTSPRSSDTPRSHRRTG